MASWRLASANADIKATYRAYSNAQAQIIKAQGYAQATAEISSATKLAFGQVQAYISVPDNARISQRAVEVYISNSAPNARISQRPIEVFIQATNANARISQRAIEVWIKASKYKHGQAEAYIYSSITQVNSYGQAQAFITGYGIISPAQAQASIKSKIRAHGQALATIKTPLRFGQAQAYIRLFIAYGQAQAKINAFNVRKYANSQGRIKAVTYKYAQSQARIKASYIQYAQAQAYINIYGFAQAQAHIKSADVQAYGQAQAFFGRLQFGQAQANIVETSRAYGQSKTSIKTTYYPSAQAQARLNLISRSVAQSLALIGLRISSNAQAQAQILQKSVSVGQSQGSIIGIGRSYAQAQAFILKSGAYAQAQAKIISFDYGQYAQAQGAIKSTKYLVLYNNYELPGYAQYEEYTSEQTLSTHVSPYVNGSLSEYLGLQNKIISLRMRLWEEDYTTCKSEAEKATTMIRSSKGFNKLYIQVYNKYYLAIGRKIAIDKSASQTGRLLDYEVEFEAKPWLLSNDTCTISGVNTISTDQVSRTIYNGGWSPVTLRLSGTNITVSGYTSTGVFTGFVSVSGTVSNLEINSEAYTATINGVNKNNVMKSLDYTVYVGPGKTSFDISGATDCSISWQDRWYL